MRRDKAVELVLVFADEAARNDFVDEAEDRGIKLTPIDSKDRWTAKRFQAEITDDWDEA